jgi:hypothetical protein
LWAISGRSESGFFTFRIGAGSYRPLVGFLQYAAGDTRSAGMRRIGKAGCDGSRSVPNEKRFGNSLQR